jgi:hypothetical protein
VAAGPVSDFGFRARLRGSAGTAPRPWRGMAEEGSHVGRREGLRPDAPLATPARANAKSSPPAEATFTTGATGSRPGLGSGAASARSRPGYACECPIRHRTYDHRMASGDPKHPLAFPFGGLTDDEFDEIVYLLGHASDSTVAKLRAPDGGLDTVRPSDQDPLIAAWGIQAKRYRDHIRWASCKESLDRAVSIWQAPKVTFAFPRDLTAPQHKLFHKHLTGRHVGVDVDWWGYTKLTALLLASPAGRGIAKRFFHTEDPADLADRAIRAGAPLRTATDLLERDELTSDFLQSADPHFSWVTTKRPRNAQPVPVTPGAALRLEFGKGDQEVVFDAIPRTSSAGQHFGPSGTISFPDKAEWQRACDLIAAVDTHGGRANLGAAQIRLRGVPAPFDELFERDIRGDVLVRLRRAAQPWAARLTADTDGGHGSVDIDLLPEDPEDDWDSKLAGSRHGLRLELRFVWSHSEASGQLSFSWSFTKPSGSAEERARILGFLISLYGTGTFEVSDREGRRPPLTDSTTPARVPDDLRYLHRAYTDLITVQDFASLTFTVPDEIEYDEAYHLALLAQWIRDGGYNASMSSLKVQCGADALAAFRGGSSDIEVRETLYANLFGDDVPVGTRAVSLPPMLLRKAMRIQGREPIWSAELVPLTGESAPVRFTLTPLDQDSSELAA